jgi:hypothetical protein
MFGRVFLALGCQIDDDGRGIGELLEDGHFSCQEPAVPPV